jgi:hypothetical protein
VKDQDASRPVLEYAHGRARKPESLRVLQVIDVVFALAALVANGWMICRFTTFQPSVVDGQLEVWRITDWIRFAELCGSFVLALGLLAIAAWLGGARTSLSIRLHRWYGWIKLLLAAIFAFTLAWPNYSDATDIDSGDLPLAVGVFVIVFLIGATHPIIVLIVMHTKLYRDDYARPAE